MMLRLFPLILLLLCAACQPSAPANVAPTVIPFPTMTPGRVVQAMLPPSSGLPLNGFGLANPATAIALANQPTATPNYRACPAPNSELQLAALPALTARDVADSIEQFLNSGGTLVNLERGLRETWNAIIAENGFVRGDLDFSGEGMPEAVISLRTADEGGMLLILTCIDGRYTTVYQTTFADLGAENVQASTAPSLIASQDINQNPLPELIFTMRTCANGAQSCEYYTQIAAWSAERGRVNNLLSEAILSEAAPTLEDIDQDRVSELIVRLDNPGNASTGPLRTGYTVYDWDGLVYTESVTQLNPPRFRIQVIHQADAAFEAGDIEEAVALYDLALNSPALEPWRGGDEEAVLQTYTLYRLLLAYAFTQDARLVPTVQNILSSYPDVAASPVYIELAITFWNAYQVTNNLNAGCLNVHSVITARPEAVDLLNRYGSRSPTYTADDVCPF
jgi:hypothetical protein